MISNGPSRTFTQEAVEAWFRRLCSEDWETFFSPEQLKKAQEYYRAGYLSTIDIQENQAVITKKINREETYSVVEWTKKGPEIRTSLDEEEIGIALATAGLYEIEELIAELHEDDPLLGEGSMLIEKNEDYPADEEKEVSLPESTTEESAKIKLLIRMEISSQKGLRAIPEWQRSKSNRIPVYSTDASNIEDCDRPALMRFVAEAGKFGFQFQKGTGEFLLNDWKKVAKLADESLAIWENSFAIEYGGDAHLLKQGQRTLSWEIEARSRDDESMILRENFHVGNRRLGTQHIRRVTRARQGATFIQGYGLVKLDQDQVEDFEWWQRNRGDAKRAHWPRYMLFSLFARKYLKTRADGQLEHWRDSIKKLSTNGVGKKFLFLRPYQIEGVAHLYALHQLGCHPLLADEMGLGKTVQTLALLHAKGSQELPDLVTCPASVVPVWQKEAAKHFPKLQVRILSKDETFEQISEPCLWIASYTQLRRHRHLLDQVEFRYAVLDEAQLIKNPKAKVTQACLSIDAQHRLALSGTPIENSALDLWTIFRFLMPGLLGARKELEKCLIEDSFKTLQLLRRQVTPFVLRRMKNDVAAELPPKLETELPCPLNDEQRKAYRALAEGGLQEHGNDLHQAIQKSSMHVFSLLTRLRQACCDLALLPDREHLPACGAKSDLLIEKLHDLSSSGAKVLVFSQFTTFLSLLKKRIKVEIPSLEVLELTGSTRDRSKPVDRFESSNDPIVMLASLKAAGLGVTLKSADYVFLMDPWWNPAVEEQAIDRAHRLGRQKPTFIYRMVAQGTIEERVRQLQLQKKETFRQVIGDLEKPSGLADHFSSLEEL
ncbi:MAG: DEAD/DEAH box helicase, partial [Opitutae bacterium]